jgi:hypothetical protein
LLSSRPIDWQGLFFFYQSLPHRPLFFSPFGHEEETFCFCGANSSEMMDQMTIFWGPNGVAIQMRSCLLDDCQNVVTDVTRLMFSIFSWNFFGCYHRRNVSYSFYYSFTTGSPSTRAIIRILFRFECFNGIFQGAIVNGVALFPYSIRKFLQ